MSWNFAELYDALTQCNEFILEAIPGVGGYAQTGNVGKVACMSLAIKIVGQGIDINPGQEWKANGQKMRVIEVCATLQCVDEM